MNIHREISGYITLLSNAQETIANSTVIRRNELDVNYEYMYEELTIALELLYHAGYHLTRIQSDTNLWRAERALTNAKLCFQKVKELIYPLEL